MFDYPRRVHTLGALILSVIASSALAVSAPVEYSADAVLSKGENPPVIFKTYVGKNRVRTESTLRGQDLVQIIDTESKTTWILLPSENSYLEKHGAAIMPATGADNSNPCRNLRPGVVCKKIGKEKIDGRETTKWEIIWASEEQNIRVLKWIDEQRNFPIRVERRDDTTELKLIGNEDIAGRQTEKWQMTNTRINGEKIVAIQWYDPELNTAIREEMPEGLMRELRNIRVAPQPASLFQIPAGYQKVSPGAKPGTQN